MKVAAIDLGTNSFLCLIAKKGEKGLEILSDSSEVVRLGQGMYLEKTKTFFQKEALQRAKECLELFRKSIDEKKVDSVQAVATAAARNSTNSHELIKICESLKIPIRIISGDEEAKLTYQGANFQLPISEYMVVDIGGGSTEILWKEEGVLKGESLAMGAVQLTEEFQLLEDRSEKNILKAKSYIQTQLKRLPPINSELEIIAVAGTPTSIAKCELGLKIFDVEKIHGYKMKDAALHKWLKTFDVPLEQRKEIFGLDPKRADIIFAGTLILSRILDFYNKNALSVSIAGIRYALVEELLS